MGLIYIKEYKGFDIEFDPDSEKFTASGNTHDNHFVKPSISALKKVINEFIKENSEFGEFKIQYKEINYRGLPITYTVIGVTTDKRLRYRDDEGRIRSFSKYDLDNYIIYREENQSIFQKQVEFQTESLRIQEEFNKKIKEVGNSLKVTTLGEFIKASNIDVDTRKW